MVCNRFRGQNNVLGIKELGSNTKAREVSLPLPHPWELKSFTDQRRILSVNLTSGLVAK